MRIRSVLAVSVAVIGTVSLVARARADQLQMEPTLVGSADVSGDALAEPGGADSDEPLPSLAGSVGLLRMSTAEAGTPRRLRLSLHGEYSSSDDLVIKSDHNEHLQGTLTFGYTPIRFLEVFGSLYWAGNRNERTASEPNRTDPEVIRSFGDAALGTKFARPLLVPGLSAGGELSLRLLSSTSGMAFDPGATSVWFGGVATYDLRETTSVPLRFHLNGGYYVDNSSSLQNYSRVSLGSRAVSSYAYGIGKDRLRMAVGADVPWTPPGSRVSLQPFAEYHIDVVTGNADPAYVGFRNNRDQHGATFGLRARLPGGLAVDAGADVSVRTPGKKYGNPVAPFTLVMGLAYPLDMGVFGKPRVVTRTVTVEKIVPVEKAPPPREGFIIGKITSARGGEPVSGAVVGVSGRNQSRIATEADGTFSSKGLPPGQIALEISAPNFEPKLVPASVVLGQSTEIAATLTPKDPRGRVQGRLVDENGRGVAGVVHFMGPEPVDARADETGSFSATLRPGSYAARVEVANFLNKQLEVGVVEGAQPGQGLEWRLRRRPGTPGVLLKNDRLTLRNPVTFRTSGIDPTAELTPQSMPVLEELADLLVNHPEIHRLRIEAHWDNTIGPRADDLTISQAAAVSSYLARAGVAQERLEAVGMGARKPLVPNIGHGARIKNRRLELRVSN